jgi:tetratricopeptide (TPR) repeat protein
VNQFLCQEYITVKDSVNYVKALQDGILLFPHEDFFIQNLVSYSVQTNTEADAVAFFSTLIENNPNEPLYYVKRGVLYEMLERFDEATADFDKVLSFDANNADAIAGKGRVIYNKAVKMNEAAASIVDNKEYKKAIDDMNEVFRESLPFFEKAHELSRIIPTTCRPSRCCTIVSAPNRVCRRNTMLSRLNSINNGSNLSNRLRS